MTGVVVAVDGPAGSGKSSVSRSAAQQLGFSFLDTGAAYRAIAWRCLNEGIDTLGGGDVVESLPGFECELGTDPDDFFVRVGGEDVSDDIREPRVTKVVSAVARIPEVRNHLVDFFRDIIREDSRPGIIVEGRDITTVVAPDAPVRILLTAAPEVRMARRAGQLLGVPPEQTAAELTSRDTQDSQVVDFMKAAPGVTTLDSTDLDFEGTVAAVVDLIRTETS